MMPPASGFSAVRRLGGALLALTFTLAAQTPAASKLTPLTVDAYNKLVASHKGHVVLVSFWATYCIPCRAEIPQLVKLAERLRPRGVDLILVSADDADQEAKARKFIAPLAPAAPIYIKSADDDDKYAAAIHPRWDGELPANFIFDRYGKKVGAYLGEVPTKTIQDVIEKFL